MDTLESPFPAGWGAEGLKKSRKLKRLPQTDQPICVKTNPLQSSMDVHLPLAHPTRLQPPASFNSPKRDDDALEASGGQSTTADRTRQRIYTQLKGPTRTFKSKLHLSIRDYQMLAATGARAGDVLKEGTAHFNMGILYDNMRDYTTAVRCYEKFVRFAKRTGDLTLLALGYNALAVSYHLKDDFAKAVFYHKMHRSVAGVRGKILALCNEGLAHREVGDFEKAEVGLRFGGGDVAQRYFGRALEASVRLADHGGESLAAGQLGITAGKKSGDSDSVKEGERRMVRHLEIAVGSGELTAENASMAYSRLGALCNRRGEFKDAQNWYGHSRSIAVRISDEKSNNIHKCHIGVVRAHERMAELLESKAAEEKKRLLSLNGGFEMCQPRTFDAYAEPAPSPLGTVRPVDTFAEFGLESSPIHRLPAPRVGSAPGAPLGWISPVAKRPSGLRWEEPNTAGK